MEQPQFFESLLSADGKKGLEDHLALEIGVVQALVDLVSNVATEKERHASALSAAVNGVASRVPGSAVQTPSLMVCPNC